MILPTLGTRPILAAINHLLAGAPWARERLAPHSGRTARLHAEPFDLCFAVAPDGTFCADDDGQPVTVTLSLPLSALTAFARGDSDAAMRAVRIEGAADFADALGFVFRNLRWDVEEDLSRVLGDIAAHRVIDGARALRAAQRRALDAVGGNVAEYLTEEQRFLVTHAVLGAHADEVQALRDDAARLSKRLDRLATRASTPKTRSHR